MFIRCNFAYYGILGIFPIVLLATSAFLSILTPLVSLEADAQIRTVLFLTPQAD